MSTGPIREDQLHAYADGRLDAAEGSIVANWLADRPQLQDQVRAWRELNTLLHGRYDRILQEPIPAPLLDAMPRRSPLTRLRVAAAIGWLALGAAIGFGLRGELEKGAVPASITLPHAAAIAHAVYSPEVRHPVEVSGDQEQHLIAWLSKRLGTPVKAPALREEGFELVGGRLLPGDRGPVAQFMYQDTRGQRLTLYIRTDASDNRETAFRFQQEGRIGVFYWLDGKLGYALSGELAQPQLMRVATAVYRQINP